MSKPTEITTPEMSHEEVEEQQRRKRQQTRSLAIALGLVALGVLFYLVTIVRLGGSVFNRPL
jgi:hypothetical protein